LTLFFNAMGGCALHSASPELYKIGLNMFLVLIKLRPSNFSPYLILIVFLIPTKKLCTQY